MIWVRGKNRTNGFLCSKFMLVVYKPGDQVLLVDDVGTFVFKSAQGAMATVEDTDGFTWEVPMVQIIPVSAKNRIENKLSEQTPPLKDRVSSPVPPRPEPTEEVWEVDLHIHELVDRHAHMTNYEMLTVQMTHFRSVLKNARSRKIKKLVVIHGVGQGVLRAEIHRALLGEERCSFGAADFRRYGLGATEVRIW